MTNACTEDNTGWCGEHHHYGPVHLCGIHPIGLSRCWNEGEFDVGGEKLACQAHLAQAVRILSPVTVRRREERTS